METSLYIDSTLTSVLQDWNVNFCFGKLWYVADIYVNDDLSDPLSTSANVSYREERLKKRKLEQIQRALLKRGWRLRFLYSTTSIRKSCEVLPVCQLSIRHTMLKAHSLFECDPHSMINKYHKHSVFPHSPGTAVLNNESFVFKILFPLQFST